MLKKVIAVNSARKNMSTANLLQRALEGAREKGAQTEIIHLHDYNVNGCKGCMACKMLKNVPPKRCLQNDELAPILEKCVSADVLIVGSPIYMWQPGGFFRCFSERYLYPYFIYGNPKENYFPNKNQKIGLVFSMGAPVEMFPQFEKSLQVWEQLYQAMANGKIESVKAFRTWHVKPNSFPKYELDCLNEPERTTYNNEWIEKNLEEAYQMGKRLAE
ncbi:iron-sulfur flavoprotein [Tritrichomonas foetus]|uniref:Iron-sulfur flavoprotein n=1 Tax=Tritrichomonas foetus TaxID=1144522 RepID=A0A1J4K068_9EUKA|nr:iron-sulfur flavoprotein [Tritrichomonas foetus]|eukprot:OHT04338.1 iron-sulfur flavoprotein [Tritrichomonas foetus]